MRRSIAFILAIMLGILFHMGLTHSCEAQKQHRRVTENVESQKSRTPGPETIWGKEWGVGLMLGDVSGVNAKYWLNPDRAFDFAIGSMINSGIGLHSDYLIHLRPFADTPEVPINVGGGLFLGGTSDTFSFGVRGSFGIAYMFSEPFDVFFELVPKVFLLPELEFGIYLALGGRIYI